MVAMSTEPTAMLPAHWWYPTLAIHIAFLGSPTMWGTCPNSVGVTPRLHPWPGANQSQVQIPISLGDLG